MLPEKLTLSIRAYMIKDVFKHPRKILPILRYAVAGKFKQVNELYFWLLIIQAYVKWYKGEMPNLYNIPSPKPREKIRGYSVEENAIRTWARADREKYLRHLLVPRDAFAGKKVLDVGCGPLPYAAIFMNCDIFGLEPLLSAFKELGFPLGDPTYSDKITYIEAPAENIPVDDNSFDVVISVNAIDHVEDFPAAAREICRVIKPDGILHIEVHYHKPTVTEPWMLNDETVTRCFRTLGIKKISERPYTKFYSDSTREEAERLVIWSNRKVGTL